MEDLEKLRSDLRLEKMILVAHSMGSFLALIYIKTHPERVERLVLIAPIPVRDSLDQLQKDMTRVGDKLSNRPEVLMRRLRPCPSRGIL
jgi:pimeloyl-ACP methyl ester carboxylesterase